MTVETSSTAVVPFTIVSRTQAALQRLQFLAASITANTWGS